VEWSDRKKLNGSYGSRVVSRASEKMRSGNRSGNGEAGSWLRAKDAKTAGTLTGVSRVPNQDDF